MASSDGSVLLVASVPDWIVLLDLAIFCLFLDLTSTDWNFVVKDGLHAKDTH